MGVGYVNLAKSIALRANQLGDTTSAVDFNTNYRDGDLQTIMQGLEVPFSALREDILATEAEVAVMIANSSVTPLRRKIFGDAVIVSGDDVPSADDGNLGPFIGKPEGVFNKATDNPLQLMDKQTVLRRIRNSGKFFRITHDIYCIEGTKIFFACAAKNAVCNCGCTPASPCQSGEALYRGCAWSRSRAETAFTAKGESILPIEVGLLWRNMVLANISQENWFTGEAQNFGAFAQQSARTLGLEPDPSMMNDVVATNMENKNVQSHNR